MKRDPGLSDTWVQAFLSGSSPLMPNVSALKIMMEDDMRVHINYIVILIALSSFITCVDKPVHIEDEKPIIAIGTPEWRSETFDPQLVLELNKARYDLNESIHIILYLENLGDSVITIAGVLPYRNIANPPTVNIWSENSVRFIVDEISENMQNDNIINIQPSKKKILMDFDLLRAHGFIVEADKDAKEFDDIGKQLIKGMYSTNAFFGSPPMGFCNTDTIAFVIE